MTRTTILLNDVFPDWLLGDGVFTNLNSYEVPWKSRISQTALDMEYHGNFSGGKMISPLVRKLLSDDNTLSPLNKTSLILTIFEMYKLNWSREFQTLLEVYNPINNYDMVEQMTNDITTDQHGLTTTRTNNLTHGKTGTETDTPNIQNQQTNNLTDTINRSTSEDTTTSEESENTLTGTDGDLVTNNLEESHTGGVTTTYNTLNTSTPRTTQTTENSVYGFNSATAVPDTTTEVTMGGNGTEAKTGTESNSDTSHIENTGTVRTEGSKREATIFSSAVSFGRVESERDTTTRTGTQTTVTTGTTQRTYNTSDTDTGTQTDAQSGTDTHTRNYTLTRSGNIGVTTSQQMIESEREVYYWNFFFRVVFPDIDKILTLAIY